MEQGVLERTLGKYLCNTIWNEGADVGSTERECFTLYTIWNNVICIAYVVCTFVS